MLRALISLSMMWQEHSAGQAVMSGQASEMQDDMVGEVATGMCLGRRQVSHEKRGYTSFHSPSERSISNLWSTARALHPGAIHLGNTLGSRGMLSNRKSTGILGTCMRSTQADLLFTRIRVT